MMKQLYKPFMAFGALVALTACGDDAVIPVEDIPTTDGRVEATIAVSLPRPEDNPVESRDGETVPSDCDILTADGLIFDENGNFLERIPAAGIVREGDIVKITLLFDATPRRRTVHLVANSRYYDSNADRVNFSALNVGTPEAAVANLQTIAPDETVDGVQERLAPPIMWGRLVLSSGITQNTSMGGVKLLRACAMVTVATAEATPANGLSDFRVLGATLCDASKVGYITPTDNATTAPTGTPKNGRPSNIMASRADTWMTTSSIPQLYCYDRNCTTSSYMGVIIKGEYMGRVGYYKVLMCDNSGTPYNVVRNHRYTITITAVTAYGYTDLATAIASKPCNTLKVSLTDADATYSSVTADQQYVMRMSCNTFELFGRYTTTEHIPSIKLATVRSDRAFTPELIFPEDQDYTWIDHIHVSPLGGNVYALLADFEASDTYHEHGEARYHEVTIKVVSDNLELPLTIKWHCDDVAASATDCHTVNLINPGETSWRVTFLEGQTSTPWCGLNNSLTPAIVNGTAGYVTEISNRYDRGAYLHVNSGLGNQARLRKSCGAPDGTPISAEMVVLRHN